jgi:hypothetical protein
VQFLALALLQTLHMKHHKPREAAPGDAVVAAAAASGQGDIHAE